jgi:chemotaxis protein MotB
MNGPEPRGKADIPLPSERSTDAEEAMVALTEVERLAAERRAVVENLLAEVRGREENLANEHNAIAALAAAADAAYAGEREAAERARRTGEELAALMDVHEGAARRDEDLCRVADAAKAEIDAAQDRLQLACQALEAAMAARSAHQITLTNACSAEAEAQVQFDGALRFLDERRDARERADVRARIELLSGTNSLSTEAAKRVVERRAADTLRHGAQ